MHRLRHRQLHRLTTLILALALALFGSSITAGAAHADAVIQITDSADPVQANTNYNYVLTIPDNLYQPGGYGTVTIDLTGAAATFTGVYTTDNDILGCNVHALSTHAECHPVNVMPSGSTTITFQVRSTAAGTVTATTTISGDTPWGGDSTTTTIDPAPPAPTVTAISPTSGPIAGGTTVTITGTGLSSAFGVAFGPGNFGTSLSCTATSCTVTSPAHAAGTVHVVVGTPYGISTPSPADEFTYTAPAVAPTVTAISPTSGTTAGGTVVTITGTDLSGATGVTFGPGNAATAVACTPTSCTATSPAHAAGTVHVQVTTAGGTSATSSADEYTYTAPGADLATSITDSADPVALGDAFAYTVTVTNNGPANATGVSLATTLSGAARTIVSATASQGSCSISAPTVTCPLGSLANAASATVTITVEPTATGTLSATAAVTGTEPDPTPVNNSVAQSTTIGNGHGCTITGTAGNDTLNGTNGADVICGFGGNDTINGGNSGDLIYAGTGNDTVDGGNADDTLYGGDGDDIMGGGNGADYLYGEAGNDTNYGETLLGSLLYLFDNGNDHIYGGPGNDDLDGQNGNDVLLDTSGTDAMSGNLGNDTINVQDGVGGDSANGGLGSDTCTVDAGDTTSSC
ncbi:IPT/TIG domain-containing protein [Streptosporangium roseum]|uniref:IPT/TIG domain-containing protein n=1 Tax=Streptosporangium roseum TaxID=2001 RepID=UPI0033242AFA